MDDDIAGVYKAVSAGNAHTAAIRFDSGLRVNNIAIDTNYYKMKGGMQITRTKERVMASGLYLLNKYPNHCKVNNIKKNKEFFEIKLKHKR